MLELTEISRVGFGSYRISDEPEHIAALEYSIQNGVNLIDTAATYTRGVSETVVGQVLKKVSREHIFVVTKAGYVTGDILDEVRKLKIADNEIVRYGENNYHCIHPLFLDQRLQLSLSRLRTSYCDGFLLHNPEYYFQSASPTSVGEYLDRTRKAFAFLEEQVQRGIIRYYGISSNTFPLPPGGNNSTQLIDFVDLAKSVSASHHFKIIQFPYNFYEQGASVNYGHGSLIDQARKNEIMTFGNRPFNAHVTEGTFRLVMDIDSIEAKFQRRLDPLSDFEVFKASVENGLLKNGRTEKFLDFAILKYLNDTWDKFQLLSQHEQVFRTHLAPFLEALSDDDTANGNELTENFYAASRQCTINNMRARLTFVQREAGGTSHAANSMPRALVDFYLKNGLDCVLVGMRSVDYVKSVI